MIERNKSEFPDINDTDRVFECDGDLVKVRIVRRDVHRDGLITNPQAITLFITGAACDGMGRAIKSASGHYYICSRGHTITLENMNSIDFSEKVMVMVKECCELTINQKYKIEQMNALINNWGSRVESFTG